jgi:uncharacterized protein (TIGR03032 family)
MDPDDHLHPPLVEGSPAWLEWLLAEDCALAFTTYEAHRLFFVGTGADGRLKAHERIVTRCQGLCVDGRALWVAGQAHLWRFADALEPGERTANGADRLYVPRLGYVTGALDVHDIAVGRDGLPIFANTRFSCLSVPDADRGFRPVWRPRFISALRNEDRCHLNGLALDAEGRPAFVTALGRSDVMEGWRDHRVTGGVLVDVASSEIVCAGLSMPHAPRLHRGRVWLLNSGTGELGVVDPAAGRFEPVCFCPGFVRGLAFHGKWAVVGMSRPRGDHGTFAGLPLEAALERRGAFAQCGLAVVDTESGTLAHMLRLRPRINELYDVVVLPGVRRAEALGLVDTQALVNAVAQPDEVPTRPGIPT